MKQLVNWEECIQGKDRAEWFIELARLNDIDSKIIRGRRDGKYQFQVASEANISIDTVKARTSKLIMRYKKLMKIYPEILAMEKEYADVSAVVSIITKDNTIYSVAFSHENFDSFDDIRTEVMRRIEKTYKIKISEIGKYRTVIGGSYNRDQTKKD